MTYNNIRHNSFYISLLVHVIIFVLLYFYTFNVYYSPTPPVEVSFGTFGETGSAGAKGTQIVSNQEEAAKPVKKNRTEKKAQEVKKVDLPKAENTSEDNIVTPADKNKKISKAEETKSDVTENSNVTTEGQGNKSKGNGSFGPDSLISWGGKGKRQIYSYPLPSYPQGVQKQIDIRFKFTIMPDGTVGSVLPLTKADAKLENLAITYLRQWRFEPLSPNQPQIPQTAVIVFPFILQ